ncbi:hypothetical protein Tco_0375312 [Tanacetum coccineum]
MGMLKLFGLKGRSEPYVTEDELKLMLRRAELSGAIEEEEQDMIENVLEIKDTYVREVMTPLVDVVASDSRATLIDFHALWVTHQYLRVPVFEKRVDNIVGIAYAMDLLISCLIPCQCGISLESSASRSSYSKVDSCSKSCMKAYATLKEQYDNLSFDYKKSQFNLLSYKEGLESVEARLVYYKKNEAVLEDSINVLKLKVRLKDNALDVYKLNLEKAKAERDQLKQTLEKFQYSSKSLNEILKCQVIDKFKKGLGYDAATATSPVVEGFVNLTDKSGSDKAYHTVPSPLSWKFLTCNEKTVENKGVFNTVESNTVKRECCAPINKELVSDVSDITRPLRQL